MKRTDTPFFTAEQKKLLKAQLKGAPDIETERFFIVCERTGLDPFSRQVYARVQKRKVKNGDKWESIPEVVIITSIDGFRAIAERSGEYRGQTKPEWYYLNKEGVLGWHDVCLIDRDKGGNPITKIDACRIGVLRKDFPEPCYGIANFDSFAAYQKDDNNNWSLGTFWKKMPEHMISKVAEAQAIRKAFPLLACGLFVEEEVEGDPETPTPAPSSTPTPTVDTKGVVAPTDEEKKNNMAGGDPEPKAEKTGKKPKAEKPEPKNENKGEVPEWQEYTISLVKNPQFKGKKLGALSLDDLEALKSGWVDAFAEKIKGHPDREKEAAMIKQAFQARFDEKQ